MTQKKIIFFVASVLLVVGGGVLYSYFSKQDTVINQTETSVHAPESLPGDDVEVEGDMITDDNVRIHYWFYNRGTDTVTVFLHGGPGRGSHDFRDTYMPDGYADRFGSLLVFDQRGGGQSDTYETNPNVKPSSITFARFIQDINELRDYVIPGHPVVIWGRSFGGLLAAAYANSHPDNVKAYVLFSPGTFDQRVVEEGAEQINALNNGISNIADFVTTKASNAEKRLLQKEALRRPKHDAGLPDSTIAAGDAMNDNEHILTESHYGLLASMEDIPVFIQYGSYDTLVPPLAIEAMKPYLHNATYFEIPAEDHFAAYAHPDEVFDQIEAFFQANQISGLR